MGHEFESFILVLDIKGLMFPKCEAMSCKCGPGACMKEIGEG